MPLKKTDLAMRLGQKIEGQMKRQGAPQRFAQASTALPVRERRDKEAAAALVSVACKLPAPLVAQLREAATQHPGKLNGLMAELLSRALAPDNQVPQDTTTKKTAAKKAAAKKVPAKKTSSAAGRKPASRS